LRGDCRSGQIGAQGNYPGHAEAVEELRRWRKLALSAALRENASAKLKALLRKAAEPSVDGRWSAIGRIIDCFTQTECSLEAERKRIDRCLGNLLLVVNVIYFYLMELANPVWQNEAKNRSKIRRPIPAGVIPDPLEFDRLDQPPVC
jgi:hypothetical protein